MLSALITHGTAVARFAVAQTQENIRQIAAIPGSIKTVNDSLVAFAQTVARLDTLVRRLDHVLEPLEGPLQEIAPRLELLIPLLNAELLDGAAEALAALRTDALPALAGVAATQEQVALIASSVDRLMTGLDDAVSRIGGLPGAGLISRRIAARTGGSPALGG
jgi:ABC-type transporter Mla subunit MlaD